MYEGKTFLGIIPARGGSKGLPGKNIRVLNGKPLIAYTIDEAKKSKYLDRVIISTEDSEIARIGKEYGAELPFLRPKHLAGDEATTNEVILHAVNYLKETENYIPDYICLLQCTSPLREVSDINGTIERLVETGMDAAVSVCEAAANPYWTNIFNGDKLQYFIKEGKKILRRQDLPKVYQINGAVYVVKTSVFIKENTLEPENTTGFIMSPNNSTDIDSIIDFKLAELIQVEREKNR